MGIPVKLQVFEGPLDLLLHLIEKNKIDIYDIPIVEITSQYMEYIRQMEREDLNVMSEFLVMAATLLDIKCRMLLPKEINEEGEEEDPRAELVEQLLQYKMYKYNVLRAAGSSGRCRPVFLPGGRYSQRGEKLCSCGRSGSAFRGCDAGTAEEDFPGSDAQAGREDRSGAE